jgi:hypothetical protein
VLWGRRRKSDGRKLSDRHLGEPMGTRHERVAKILGFMAAFVAFFAVLPSIGQDGPQVPHAKPYVDSDAYAIYAVLLTAQKEKFFVIESEMQRLQAELPACLSACVFVAKVSAFHGPTNGTR